MKLEVGKYYSGVAPMSPGDSTSRCEQIHVLGYVKSDLFGTCYLAESTDSLSIEIIKETPELVSDWYESDQMTFQKEAAILACKKPKAQKKKWVRTLNIHPALHLFDASNEKESTLEVTKALISILSKDEAFDGAVDKLEVITKKDEIDKVLTEVCKIANEKKIWLGP